MSIQEIDFVSVVGGTFGMGSNTGDSDSRPAHDETVSSFRMGRYPIRLHEFDRFVEDTGYRTIAEVEGGCNLWDGDS